MEQKLSAIGELAEDLKDQVSSLRKINRESLSLNEDMMNELVAMMSERDETIEKTKTKVCYYRHT